MGPYHRILLLLVHVLGVASLMVDPSTSSFAAQNNSLLNFTSDLNQKTIRPDQIECQYRPDQTALDAAECQKLITPACQRLAPRFRFMIPRNIWVWTSSSHCALAFYAPSVVPKAPAARLPSLSECQHQIYNVMIAKCAYTMGATNVGTINVDTLPTTGNPGRALLDEYPRYLIATEEMD